MKIPPSLKAAIASIAAVASLLSAHTARAANVIHSLSTTGATTWNTAVWSPVGTPNAVGDVAAYTGTIAGTTTLDVSITMGVIRNSGTGGPGSWTIATNGVNTFTLDGTGLTAGNNPFGIAGEAALSLSTNAPFIIDPNITIANTNLGIGTTGNSQITINGSITASSAQTINIRGGGSGGIVLNGNIGQSGSNIAISNANSGTSSLVISGALGTSVNSVTQNSAGASMTLSGANTYVGTTTLTQGSLTGTTSTFSATPLSPFGASSLVLNGGTLSLRAPGVTGGPGGNSVVETVTFGNNVSIGGNVTVNVGQAPGIASSNNKAIAFNDLGIGAQTLSVTGANSYKLQFSGTTTATGAAVFNPTSASMNLGALTLGNSVTTGTTTAITLGGTGTTNTISGVISNNSVDPTKVLALTKSSLSTWTLNGSAVNTYTGATTVNGGTLTVDLINLGTPTDLINSASALNLGGGTLTVRGKTATTASQTLGNLTLTANSGQSAINMIAVGTSTNLTLGNTWTRGAGSILNMTIPANTTITSGVSTPNGIIGGYAVIVNGTAASFATISGGVVTAASTSGLTTSANDGTVNYSSSATVAHDAGNWAVNSLVLNGSSLNIGGGTLTLTSGGLLTRGTSNGTDTISNGQLGATNSEVIIHTLATATRNLEVSANITGGSGSLTKGGSRTLILTADNTYTGNTVVGAGTLQIGNGGTAGGIASSANVILQPGATLAYNATDASSVKNVTGGGIVNVNSGTLTLLQSGSGLTIRTVGGLSGSTIEFAGDGTGVTSLGVTALTDPPAGSQSYLTVAGMNYKFTGGTVNLLDNARGSASNIEIAGGTLNVVNNPISFSGVAGGTQTFTISSGQLNATASNGISGFNGNGGATQAGVVNSTFVGTQTGGTISVTAPQGRFDMGNTSAGNVTTYNFSGGTISHIGPSGTLGMTLGADTAGTSSTTFNFSGGKLIENATIAGGQSGSARQAFVWTGGTLAAFGYNATNLTSVSGAAYTGNVGTLTNGGGILAPGDIGTAGRTLVTGNYSVTSANGSYTADIGGTTAASVFQAGPGSHDQVVVIGNTTLGGRLDFNLINSFVPPANNTTLFAILRGNVAASSAVTGAFTNQVTATSGNSRVVGADGLSSFLLAINNTASTASTGGLTNVAARNVALGDYKTTNTYSGLGTAWDTANAAAWTNFDAGATATPATQASGAIAQFADGTASTGSIGLNLNSTRNIQGIQFASAAGSRAYTISTAGSGAIILDNTRNAAAATIADTSTSGTVNTINVPITLNSNLAVSVTNAANLLAIDGDISGSGKTLTKIGAGVLALGGTNSYSGATTVSDGTLRVNGSLTGSAVTVEAGGTLGGDGTLIGSSTAILSGGTHAPGNSPAVQTFDNDDLTYNTGSTFQFELFSNTDTLGNRGNVTVGYDGVDLTGTSVLSIQTGVTAELVFDGTTDFSQSFWNGGHSWLVFSNENLFTPDSASFFDTITVVDNALGLAPAASLFSFSQSGNDIYLNYAGIPEPSGLLLLTGGLLALTFQRRRRHP